MTTNLLALADRVEKLTVACRLLDAEIFKAIGMPLPTEFFDSSINLSWDTSQQAFIMPVGEMQMRYEHPHFTASLDAAMTLVPKGYGFSIDYKVKDHTLCEDTTYACVRDVKKALHGDYATISTEAARHLSPALALTAACLRAIASIDKGEA